MGTEPTARPADQRPFPAVVDPDYNDHMEALATGRVVVTRCRGCGQVEWPPRPTCRGCRGHDFAPHEVEGVGVVHTFSVVHRAFHPWFSDKTPYGVAIVEVADGVRLTGFYAGSVQTLRCGLAVRGRGEMVGGAPALLWSPEEHE